MNIFKDNWEFNNVMIGEYQFRVLYSYEDNSIEFIPILSEEQGKKMKYPDYITRFSIVGEPKKVQGIYKDQETLKNLISKINIEDLFKVCKQAIDLDNINYINLIKEKGMFNIEKPKNKKELIKILEKNEKECGLDSDYASGDISSVQSTKRNEWLKAIYLLDFVKSKEYIY